MILGAHNAVSGHNPKHWWMKPFNWLSKCQNLNIRGLYNIGVRCFDIRVKINENEHITCWHGIMQYNVDFHQSMIFLNSMSNDDIYVRLCYEGKNSNALLRMRSVLYQFYPNIKFQFCSRENGWTVLENNFDKELVEIQTSPHNIKDAIKGPCNLIDNQYDKLDTYKYSDCIVLMDFVDKMI